MGLKLRTEPAKLYFASSSADYQLDRLPHPLLLKPRRFSIFPNYYDMLLKLPHVETHLAIHSGGIGTSEQCPHSFTYDCCGVSFINSVIISPGISMGNL